MKYGILIPIGIIAIFCGLIYLEHHLSCTILMFFIGACLMFAGGSDWKLFAFGLAVIVLLGFLVVSFPTLFERQMADKQFTLCYRFWRFLRCRARQFKAKISLCIRTAKRLYFFNRMRGAWFLRRCNNYCTFCRTCYQGLDYRFKV